MSGRKMAKFPPPSNVPSARMCSAPGLEARLARTGDKDEACLGKGPGHWLGRGKILPGAEWEQTEGAGAGLKTLPREE